MWLILFLGLWLLAPLVELAVIVGLYMANDANKRKVKELTMKLKERTELQGSLDTESCRSGEEGRKELGTEDSWKELGGEEDRNELSKEEDRKELRIEEGRKELGGEEDWKELRTEEGRKELGTEDSWKELQGEYGWQDSGEKERQKGGTVALMIGVVFVVLAGLVFATTAWYILSNAAKVFLVLAAAVLFFGVSYVAEHRLQLHRTGNGFYVLGSIFLFLSVLAAAYFQLLGPAYVLVGQNRWRVLWAGSVVTVGMLFLGVKRFHDWIYTQTCFWGMSVSVTFLLLACGVSQGVVWSSSMMVYAFLLMLGKWMTGFLFSKEQTSDDMTSDKMMAGKWIQEGFSKFAPVHFWIFLVPVVFYGIMGGIFRISMWLCWQEALALAAAAAGVAVLLLVCPDSLERKKERRIVFSLVLAVMIHNLAAWLLEEQVVLSILAAQTGLALWFLAGQTEKAKSMEAFASREGDWIFTLFLISDCVVLGGRALLIEMFALGKLAWMLEEELFGALAGAVLLAVVVFAWEKRSPLAKKAFPCLLWYIAFFPLKGWLKGVLSGHFDPDLFSRWGQAALLWMDRGILEFLMLIWLALWEKRRQKGYGISLLVLGSISSLLYFSTDLAAFPFLLALAAYLLTEVRAGRKGKAAYRFAFFYAMAGVYFLMLPMGAGYGIWRVMALVWIYIAGILGEERFCRKEPKEKGRHVCWDIWGCVLTGMAVGAIYVHYKMPVWGLVLCMGVFAGFYRMFYLGKRIWPHLVISFFFLPLPFVLAVRYHWSENMLYGIVGGGFLATGILARAYGKIVETDSEELSVWRVDWYHVLAAVLLAPMAMAHISSYWRFGYWILLCLYFLQYRAVDEWKALAGAAAGLMLVFAYWSQPFVEFPQLLKLELWLLPAALYLKGLDWVKWERGDCLGGKWEKGDCLGMKWEKENCLEQKREKRNFLDKGKIPEGIQKAGYIFCMLVLCVDAWISGDVANALILEGISMGIFLWGLTKRRRFSVRMGAAVLVSVALYMTKGFWFSISWWVYLLAAGIGLIAYGAVKEGKKGQGGQKG